jgi:predicted PurR-regulated permease PerM
LVATLIIAVDQLIELLSTYQEELADIQASIQDVLMRLRFGQDNASASAELVDPGKVMDLYAGLLTAAVDSLSSVFLILMTIIFMLIELFNMPAKVATELKRGNEYVQRLTDFSAEIRRYVSITTWIGLLTGTLDTIFFVFMGIPLPLLWGILAFLLSYVPVIGFWLAAIPPTILALLESGPLAAVVVFVGIILINGFADEVLKPKIMGEGLDLAPIMVIFSITIWTAVLGPLGAILGVPMTMIVKELVLAADERNAWIARLMGKGDQGPASDEAKADHAAVADQ